ncbi:MAG: DNA-processing protein DprA [Anaerohalosphaeraceae bacterium]
MGSDKQCHSEGIEHYLRLTHAEGVGPVLFARLVKQFGSVENALETSVSEMTRVEGIGNATAEKIARSRGSYDAQKEIGLADKYSVVLIHWDDGRYPAALKSVYDPPPVLYVRGTLERSDALSVAIVGSRRCSAYGSEQASRFAHLLASSGFTIVSGLARGIDTAAHRGALSAKGRTIAVQGCGLATVFPPENVKLADMIAESGAVISELPMGYEPLSENFPARNRIIAALSLGTLVVEAPHNSGSLLTAKAALEYDRDVMAIPGKIDSPLAGGCHKLIKEGAKLVDSLDDILETLGCVGQGLKEHVADAAEQAEKKAQATLFDMTKLNLSAVEKGILTGFDGEPLHIEQMIAKSGFTAGQVHASIISLQLKGLIKQLPGGLFIKR